MFLKIGWFTYNMAYSGTYEETVNLIKNYNKNIKIIDLGCGKGTIVKKLRAIGFKNIVYCDIMILR